ncbi:tetratricopeptide repeat protein [Paracoccus sediminicola]|uniref:tetratricopeptide repeat protein n=1 Tax=Paracoccus sediminicola TaxID=3017783 RepID=UPI0022EFF2A7|nr:tetratricopeptide repeat protein [Paracoccus sediminicola]WBU56957.1 tetratricopeptide repeat protein [Paracoccus sediminicola]
MSHESDSFIDEVTEEVRRDRLYAVFRRYGWIALLVIAVIVGGAAWREYSNAQRRAAAQDWGDAVLAAQQAEDPATALSELDAGGNGDRAALGALLAAGAAVEAGDDAAAGPLLDSAAESAEDAVLRDLARFKALLAAGDSMDAADRDAALTELSEPGAPFRLLALEQKAVALAEAGRAEDAVTLIREILAESGVSQALRARLFELMIALGAEPLENPAPTPAGSSDTEMTSDSDDAAAMAVPAD